MGADRHELERVAPRRFGIAGAVRTADGVNGRGDEEKSGQGLVYGQTYK